MKPTVYNTPLKVVSLVNKRIRNVHIDKGDIIDVLIADSGYAMLATNATIRFTPDEYELYVGDEEYKLLGL